MVPALERQRCFGIACLPVPPRRRDWRSGVAGGKTVVIWSRRDGRGESNEVVGARSQAIVEAQTLDENIPSAVLESFR